MRALNLDRLCSFLNIMAKTIINGLPQGALLHGEAYDYEIVKALGQGSFGITYLAKVKMHGNLGAVDALSYVAIKEFFMHEINGRDEHSVTCGSKQGLYDKYKKKFIGEARNLSKLNHEHIIKVIEAFEGNNTIYYSMEFLGGGSLDDYIQQKGYLSEKETLRLLPQIASALSFMHARHMLHLDLKPSNIMMRDERHLVLIDFGLSKQFDENGEPESSTTIGGGTPGYAPMEQAAYSGHASGGLPVTMDVYALGATSFKMLTGVRPPDASIIFNSQFPKDWLSEKQVSGKTISVIMKAMSSKTIERFQNIEAFVSAIEHEETEEGEGDEVEEVKVDGKDDIVRVIEQLVQNEQYKEAYNLCLDCIKKNEYTTFANKKCEELIPLLKKKAKKDSRKQTIIITVVTLVVTILSILLGVFNN